VNIQNIAHFLGVMIP